MTYPFLKKLKRMNQLDIVGTWLKSVAYSHSQSKATDEQYKRVWSRFSSYIGKTAEEILVDYKESDDRRFRRQCAQTFARAIGSLPYLPLEGKPLYDGLARRRTGPTARRNVLPERNIENRLVSLVP